MNTQEIENDSFMVRYSGNAKLFKHKENAEKFAASRLGSVITEVHSSCYHLQFADALPVYGKKSI